MKVFILTLNYRWARFLILSLLIFYGEGAPKKRVCVIGAGRAGLAALKTVAERKLEFEPVAFERNSDIGGLWIYTDKTGLDSNGLPVHSVIYKNLKTNLPRELMEYPDYPNFKGRDTSDHPSHGAFLEYMKNYTNHFGLRKYIQFNTLVTKVTPIKGKGDWRTTRWRLEKQNLKNKKKETIICDAVMVCNGHFTKPNIPQIPGIKTFPGRVLHSRDYRAPENFKNKKVLLLGAGVSGQDIALDLSRHAKTVYLSHRHKDNPFEEKPPANVKVVSGVVSVNGSTLTLQDKTKVTADAFIYCTGYLYDFPFLDRSSGIVVEKNKVRPLYDDSTNIEYPTMAFIGLTDDAVFGGVCYSQADYLLDTIQGTVQLPSRQEMLKSS